MDMSADICQRHRALEDFWMPRLVRIVVTVQAITINETDIQAITINETDIQAITRNETDI